jgi:hypothetical protein
LCLIWLLGLKNDNPMRYNTLKKLNKSYIIPLNGTNKCEFFENIF